MRANLKGMSLFSGAGIGELYLSDIGIDIIAANEIVSKRADCYKHLHSNTKVITGNIRDWQVKERLTSLITKDVKLLLATPPCQGLSTLGKNKNQGQLALDKRNYLIYDIFDIIDHGLFDYILIENVPRFLNMFFPYKDSFMQVEGIIRDKYSGKYNIEISVLNAKDYGVPQTRPRAIIKMYRSGLEWGWPNKIPEITLEQAIEHLPSIEAGEVSGIPWHYAPKHNERAVLALKHTPTGQSALKNKEYFPKKENGERINGFHNTFKRMLWDQPAPARTTYCGSISSHNNVHPGRKVTDGTYSDARVLTLLETFIVSSIPPDISFPQNATDNLIRTLIGEAIPPLMLKKVFECIKRG